MNMLPPVASHCSCTLAQLTTRFICSGLPSLMT